MARRLKLIVAYDGGGFSGWQSQANRNGVQDHVEAAFQRITDSAVRVHGSGRTDAGVHALGQCAHVDLAAGRLTAEQWNAALNSILPPTIRVLRARFVSRDFHARFSAKGKVYRYRIWTGRVLPPFEVGRAWHIPAALDVDLMRDATTLFVGTHDFRGFTANRGKPPTNTTRTLRSVLLRTAANSVVIDLDGDGFLYKMVRMLVGAAGQCGTGKISISQIAARLSGRPSDMAPLVAPAQGLILQRVRY
ncbi:MAG: tRNA pseudouridine(38-40) synthase TruA [Spartobacteria bacterium]